MLILWEFFWNTADWVTGSVTTTPDVIVESRGGGHKRSNNYNGPDPEFWLVRERYLRSILEPSIRKVSVPPEVSEEADATPNSNSVTSIIAEAAAILRARNATLADVRKARNAVELREAAARTIALTLALQAQLEQYYASAIFLLLLDPF